MTPREAIAQTYERYDKPEHITEDDFAWADDVIAALKSSGYRVVPEEPTEAMVAKALDVWLAKVIEDSGSNGAEAKSSVPVIYRAMLSAMENSE